MHEDATCNDLQKIITQAINEIKQEQGENFNLAKINLAELERQTGLSRSRLRHLKENNFIVTPHGRTGQKATATVLTGYSGIIDGLLLYISDKLTILHGQSDHLSRRFRSLISERYGR